MDAATSDLQSLAARVEKLERQNRWLKWGGCAVLLVFATLVVMDRTRPGHLVTSDLVLQDMQGRRRAELSMDKDSQPNLVLFGSDEGTRAVLSPSLFEFREGIGKMSTSLGMTGLFTFDDQGREVVGLGSPVTPAPFLHLFGSDKQEVWLSAGDDGPRLHMSDDSGFSATLGRSDLEIVRTGETRKTSAASLVLFGKDSKVLWSAP